MGVLDLEGLKPGGWKAWMLRGLRSFSIPAFRLYSFPANDLTGGHHHTPITNNKKTETPSI